MQLSQLTVPQIVCFYDKVTQSITSILDEYDCSLQYKGSTPFVCVKDSELFSELPSEEELVVDEGILKRLWGVDYLLPNEAFAEE